MNNDSSIPAWATRATDMLWHYRIWLLIAVLLISAAATYSALKVSVDNSLSSWFVEDSESLQEYRQFLDSFGSDDLVVVALEREDGFASVAGTRKFRQALELIASISGVSSTMSFLDITDAANRAPDFLRLETLDDLEDPGERLQLLLADSLINGRLINADATAALIIVRLQASETIGELGNSFGDNLKTALATTDLKYTAAGSSIIYAELNKLSRSESPRLLGLALFLMSALLLIFLRQIVPVMVALAASTLAFIWTLGFVGYIGGSINVLTSVIPVVILVIGISSCVHIVSHLQSRDPGIPAQSQVRAGVAYMLQPCGLAAVTTIAGFSSLMAAELPMTATLGKLLAIGIASVFVLVTLLCLLAGKYIHCRRTPDARLSNFATALATLGTRNAKLVTFLFGLAAIIAAVGAAQIKVDAFPLDLLPENHPIRQDANHIETIIGPYTTMEFVVSAGDDVLQLDYLQALDQWATRVVENGHALWSMSMLDALKRAHQVRSGGYPYREFQLPADQSEVTIILKNQKKYAADRLSEWLNPPHQLRFVFGVPAQAASGLRRNLQSILALTPTEGLQIKHAGLMPLWLSQVAVLVEAQIKSFSIALILVMGIIIATLRRRDMAILAVAVNLVPVITTLGVMGISGIRLDLGTVAVASVILGLVVDDTIHFLHRLKLELEREETLTLAVSRAAHSTGQAIVVSSIVIGVGFAVLGLAQTTSVAWFGILIAVATTTALIADLMLAPAILVLLNRSDQLGIHHKLR